MTKISEITENDRYVVARFKTSSGASFDVGYPKDGGYSASTLEAESSKDEPALVEGKDWIPVNWEPGKEAFIPESLRTRGIKSARVNEDPGAFYRYRLNFENSGGWSFEFKDMTGDVYGCSTKINGGHYIDYNSGNATIVAVK